MTNPNIAALHAKVKAAHDKALALAHTRRKWLVVGIVLYLAALWLHGEHGATWVTVLALRDRLVDGLGDVFLDRGINQ
jgi:hypothetical protein